MSLIKVIDFNTPLELAYLVRREKRFLVEFQKDKSGLTEWAHTNNTGSMLSIIRKGRPILLSKSDNPKRKLAYTLEAVGLEKSFVDTKESPPFETSKVETSKVETSKVEISEVETWVGVNTLVPNRFLQTAFSLSKSDGTRLLPWAKDYNTIRMEVAHGKSRLDACLSFQSCEDIKSASLTSVSSFDSSSASVPDSSTIHCPPPLWIECKNVSLVEDCMAAFPDAVSERGAKHLEELMGLVEQGQRAAMLYIVQRTDGKCFTTADYIDPKYGEKLREAKQKGVEIYALIAKVQRDGIYYGGELEIQL